MTILNQHIILLTPVLAPLITGVLLMFFLKHVKVQQWLNIILSFGFLVSGLVLVHTVRQESIITIQSGGWPAPFGISLVADMFSAIMVLMTGLLAFGIAIYAVISIDTKRAKFGFYPLLNIMFTGICGSVLTGDIFNLFVWFEVMLISSFVLLSLGGTKAQLEGTIKYVTINIISSTIFLAAIGILYGVTGTLNFADLHIKVAEAENQTMITVAGMLFLLTFGIKSALFPLFFWLPASYHTPPIAISAVFAGLLTKVGVYALIRVFTLVFVNHITFTHSILLYIAGFTMVVGVLGAAAQGEMRRLLSFHIISQIGYMVMGLGIYTPLALAGSVLYIAHNIIAKTNLFLISGLINRLKGTYELKKLGGLFNLHPFLGVLFLISGLSLAGIPPLSGFWSKFLLAKAGFEAEHYIIIIISLATGLLTLFSMTKIWNEAFWKEALENYEPGVVKINIPVVNQLYFFRLFTVENMYMLVPIMLYCLIILLIGFFPAFFFDYVYQAGEQLMNPEQYVKTVLN
ncbi:proton-conducting transporter membrane subunit [Cytophagaceae bacterium ABcell3]|nr:proton-conducting transporter membrane subunit [Cytophagaceae bacterium ABcell3]